ncbi:MAG: hypothetical protein SF066_23480 [Thermoanaerobaculia bacterium]|nr:hypothetical protein [Thermoanaerobaculia bacterium]
MLRLFTLWLASLLAAAAVHAVPNHPPGTRLPLTLESEAGATTTGLRHLRFDLSGSALTFQLQPFSVRSADFQLLVKQQSGALVAQPAAAPKTVRGTVLELPGSLVAGTLDANGLNGWVIDPNGMNFYVLPQNPAAGTSNYEMQVLEAITPANAQATAACALAGLCIAEVALDTDSYLYGLQGSDPGRVLDLAEGQLNIVDLRFEYQFKIRYHVTAVVVRPVPDLAVDPYISATVRSQFLGLVNSEWCPGCHPEVRRDGVHALLALPRTGPENGVADVNSQCNSTNGGWSYSWDLRERAGVMAHELGHNWGIPGGAHLTGCGLGASGGHDLLTGWPCEEAIALITARRDLVAPFCLDTLIEDLIFRDDFEDGEVASWSGQTNPGNIAVVAAPAGLFGAKALQFKMDTAAPPWLEDDSPADEKRYRARFYLNRSALTLPTDQGFLVFAGVSSTNVRMFEVRLRNSALGQGAVDVRVRARKDDGNWTGWLEAPALDRTLQVEIDWRAATAAGANDGHLSLWVDGNLAGTLAAIDNDTLDVDRARLGPSIGFPSAPDVSGVLFVDAFESRRSEFIGPE